MTDIKLNNQTLATASGSTISWGSGVPAGTVIQTFTDTFGSTATNITTEDDYLDSNLQVTITPKSTSNKLIINCFVPGLWVQQNITSIQIGFRYQEPPITGSGGHMNSPIILGPKAFVTGREIYQNAGSGQMTTSVNVMHIVDCPTTNEIIIRPWFEKYTGNSGLAEIFAFGSSTLGVASLSVQEIQS